MRLLTSETIFITTCILVLLLAIPVLNIHLFLKRKYSRRLSFIVIFSILTEALLFCIFMQMSIFPDSIQLLFRYYTQFLLICLFITLVTGIVTNRLDTNNHSLDLRISPQLHEVFQLIEDAVFISDAKGAILSSNKSAHNLPFLEQTPHTIDTLFHILEKNIQINEIEVLLNIQTSWKIRQFPINRELTLQSVAYWLLITPILSESKKHSSIIGVNLVFHKIQEEKNLKDLLEIQNNELLRANESLTENIKISSALEEEKERLSLIRDVQDSIIQNVEAVTDKIMSFQLSESKKELDDYKNIMVTITGSLRHIFSVVRANIHKLKNN